MVEVDRIMAGIANALYGKDESDEIWTDGSDDPSYLWDCGYLTGNYLALIKGLDPERKLNGNDVRDKAWDLAVYVTHDNPNYHQVAHDWHIHRWN